MAWVLAIDFGTSSTAAAAGFDGNAQPAPVEGQLTTMLSNVFLDEGSQELLLGAAADNAAIIAPWCLERTPKRRVGMQYMRLGQENIEVSRAVGMILHRAAEAAIEFQGGERPELVRLTHPVRWGKQRREGLCEAAEKAGFKRLELILEPVAAALSYAHDDLAVGQHVAVYDLGGGTFDTAVLKRTEDGFTVVGRPGGSERFGGEKFDTRLHRYLGSKLPEVQWQRLRAKPQRLADAPWAQANRQFMRNVRVAKELLTAAPETEVTVPAPVETRLRITAEEFHNLIRGDLEESVRELHRTIRSAGLETLDLAAVYLAGGSSNIPLVSRLIEERLGVEPVLLPQPKEAISIGAALGAHPVRGSAGGGASGRGGAGASGRGGAGAELDGPAADGGLGPAGDETAEPDTDETRLDIPAMDAPPVRDWAPPKPKAQPEPAPQPEPRPVADRSGAAALLARMAPAGWGIVCTLGAVIGVLSDIGLHDEFKYGLGFDVIVTIVIGAITVLELARGKARPLRRELVWLRAAFAMLLAGEYFIFTDYSHYGALPSQVWVEFFAAVIGATAGLLALRPILAPAATAEPQGAAAPSGVAVTWRQPWVLTAIGCGVIALSLLLHGTGPDEDWLLQSAWGEPSKRYAVITTLLCLTVAGLAWRGARSPRARVAAAIVAGGLAGVIVPGGLEPWKHLTIGTWLGVVAVSFTVVVSSLAAGLLRRTRPQLRD